MPVRPLQIHNAHPALRVPKPAVARVIALLDQHAAKFSGGCPPGALSLVFVTDAKIAKIHADFMDDPSATDVITFEGNHATLASLAPNVDAEELEAGEICVSADTALHYAKEHRRDFATELTLYVVHGWLHLAGYDDLQPAKKRRMRAAEKRAMTLLASAKAIPAFRLRKNNHPSVMNRVEMVSQIKDLRWTPISVEVPIGSIVKL